MYVWITIVIILLISIWLKYYYKEGLDTTPMDVVQSQQGEIESIRNQLLKLNITEDGINQIQSEIDTTADHMHTLQINMPDPQIKKYALD